MSTRAIIMRKKVAGDIELLECGQTKMDGYDNTSILNEHWTDPEKIDALFSRQRTQGICGLGEDMDDTDWFDEGDTYNYRCEYRSKRVLTCGCITIWLKEFDFPEYVSLWTGTEWLDFETKLYLKDEPECLYARYKAYEDAQFNAELVQALKDLFYPTTETTDNND